MTQSRFNKVSGETSRISRDTRFGIFLAGCEHLPIIEEKMRAILPKYKEVIVWSTEPRYSYPGLTYTSPGNVTEWKALLAYANQEETQEGMATVEQAKSLKNDLEDIVTFTLPDNKIVNLAGLGDWIYTQILGQLNAWLKNPQDKIKNYVSWPFIYHREIPIDMESKPAPKFVYTLHIGSTYRGDYENKNISADEFNPYQSRNSESDASLEKLGEKQAIYFVQGRMNLTDEEKDLLRQHDLYSYYGFESQADWNPEVGEAREEYVKKTIKDFERRLRRHLERVEKWYYEPPMSDIVTKRQELSTNDFWNWYTNALPKSKGGKHSQRHYLFVFQRYALGMTDDEIARSWDETCQNENNFVNVETINKAINRTAKRACLPKL
jgi:hypothetical protein